MFLVTGASGFLGKHLCEYFEKNNINFRACVRKKQIPHQFETGDLNNFNDWETLFKKIDCVIHAAAKAHDMSGSPDLTEIYQKVNFDLTLKLAREAKKFGVKRFIFISTIKVNGEFTKNIPFSADDTPNPTDEYGISKSKAEIELLKLHEPNKFEVVIIRPCLIYGKGVKANFNSLINIVLKGWPLPFANLKNKRSFLSVDNLIDLIVICTTHPKASGQIFLASDDNDLTMPELIYNIARAFNKKVIILPFPVALFKIAFKLIGRDDISYRLFSSLQVDINKTKTLLNWKPKYDIVNTFNK